MILFIWTALSLLGWGICGRKKLAEYADFFGKQAAWLGLLVIPAVAMNMLSYRFEPFLWGIALLVIAVTGTIALLKFGPFVTSGTRFATFDSWMRRLAAIGTACGLLILPTVVVWRFAPASGNAYAPISESLCLLSFDSEEDWQGKESTVLGEENWGKSAYLGTFRYIESRYFDRLIDGLTQRGIHATFYCTPNLARNHPEALRKIVESGHEVAVHLHPHQGRKVNYPFISEYDLDLNEYPKDKVYEMISSAKRVVESAALVQTTSFRSGEWSCDAGIEDIIARIGFESFSNHDSTFPLPSGLWQVATADSFDMMRSPEKMLLDLMDKNGRSGIFPFFSHPMVGFNYNKEKLDDQCLEHYLSMLDLAMTRCPKLKFVTTSEAVSMLHRKTPSTMLKCSLVGGFVAANGLVLLVALGVFGRSKRDVIVDE